MLKTLTAVTVKNAAKGEVSAVFSTFGVIDKDGDVVVPGAIKDGTEVVISAYQHASWQAALPIGKGVIRTTDSEAILEGKFFLDTAGGRETFEVVKELGALQEWSYSLRNVVAERGELNGLPARFLKSIDVKEVSPVLVGASVNTRTLAVKGAGALPLGLAQGGVIGADTTAGVDELRKRHAWVDVTGDPESAASYAFGHHKADGSVDLRACLLGIAQLNGAKGCPDIPDGDRRGVYDHLAEHLDDHDHRAPGLKDGRDGLTFSAQLGVALADVDAALDRAGEVMALRAAKGRGLSEESSLLIEWVRDELRKAQALLDTPDDAAAREFVRFLANRHHNKEQS